MKIEADPSFYASFSELQSLKQNARAQDPQALREAARQFESIFARMLISSMRSASFGDSLLGSDQMDFYQSMFDDQLAMELTRGRGLGLAEMLVEQLTRAGLVGQQTGEAADSTPAPKSTEAADPITQASSREDFIRALWPHAEAAGRELGVDPRTLIAHAALETGWGRSIPRDAEGRSSFNLFGVKATGEWQGNTVGARTLEFEDGIAVKRVERFRAYESAAASFNDYVSLLRNNSRYAAALGTGSDVHAFANALQQGGYATDPAYANKLAAVAQSIHQLHAADGLKNAATSPITGGGNLI